MHRSFIAWAYDLEDGNFMELTRVDDFYIKGFPVSVRRGSLCSTITSDTPVRNQQID